MRKLSTSVAGVLLAASTVVGAPARTAQAEPCTDMSRACIIEISYTYINAQGGLAPRSAIRASAIAKRWENGVNTANSGGALTGAELAVRRPDVAIVPGTTITPRFIDDWVDAERGEGFFRWMMDVSLPDGTVTSTAHILERIKVEPREDCNGPSPCITEIEAVFCIGQGSREAAYPEPKTVPGIPVVEFLCHRSG